MITGSFSSSAAASSASLASQPDALNEPMAIFFFSAISMISFNVTNMVSLLLGFDCSFLLYYNNKLEIEENQCP
jgi:hypothetical protein